MKELLVILGVVISGIGATGESGYGNVLVRVVGGRLFVCSNLIFLDRREWGVREPMGASGWYVG